MDNLTRQLVLAAYQGDLAKLEACLSAGADPTAQLHTSAVVTPLEVAAMHGKHKCLARLLSAGVDPKSATSAAALRRAAGGGHTHCVRLLLATGALPLLDDDEGNTALHCAACGRRASVVRMLLQAAPESAQHKNKAGSTPLQLALSHRSFCSAKLAVARYLLQSGPLPPKGDLLTALHHAGREAWPLFTVVAARQALAERNWRRLPTPCPGMGAALPAVLERSTSEAVLLVPHLPPSERERLRMAALCLARTQAVHGLALPTPIVWRVLALALAE